MSHYNNITFVYEDNLHNCDLQENGHSRLYLPRRENESNEMLQYLLRPSVEHTTVKYISELADNEKYIYYISPVKGNYFYTHRETGFKSVNPRVISDYRKGLCKIVISMRFEGSSGSVFPLDYIIVQEWLDELGLNPANLYFVTGNLIADKVHQQDVKYQIVPMSCFEGWPTVDHNKGIINYVPKDNCLFMSLNRMMRFNRVAMLATLVKENLFDKGLISFDMKGIGWTGGGSSVTSQETIDMHQLIKNYAPHLLDAYHELEQMQNQVVDFATTGSASHNVIHDLPSQIENCFMTLLVMARTEKNTIQIDEKIWKLINVGHPFILLSSKGTLQHLQDLGFQTFGKWFDESYDEKETVLERISIITEDIKKYSNFSLAELNSIRTEMQNVLEHNQQHFRNILSRDFTINGKTDNDKRLLDFLYDLWINW